MFESYGIFEYLILLALAGTGFRRGWAYPMPSMGGVGDAGDGSHLLETGDFMLFETGDQMLLE